MVNLIVGLTQVAFALGSPAGAVADRAWQPSVEQVRMVCDQDCNCWRTRYQERRPLLSGRDDLACPPSERRPVGYYNGYYRKGPATGVDFDSKYPVREFSFPF
ncbi:hypothetical protein CWS35_09630 [Bradyrhizobium sp. SK17]|uniref:hypothetical protein n=1 Tax=Bradyrhizobium sp. SK17 TaxID=2057741 RepID=UPI000C3047FA|nr:hypothetical protein [Bradyrhizobium sp. SK17]AUC94498.1 hypothetical protein CWS35_09630 [Bradyrhizobium sp. SK17]